MAEVLPPAILELVVDTAQWIAGLQEAIAALEEFDTALEETSANLGVFSEEMAVAMTDAAAATEDAATSIMAASEEAAAAYEHMAEAADASAASMDAAAASSAEAGKASAASSEEMGGASAALSATVEKAGLAIGTVAIASATMAGDFQASVTRLVTSANESSSATDQIKEGLMNMATQVGFTANEMAKAMYPIESAGYHAADGLTVMKAAAEGAKDEGADLTHVADAVTTVMQDYNLKASDAANITSQMVQAISFGKTNFDAFSKSLATVLPIASAVHLSFADVATVEAAMTAHGTTAQRAAQDVAAAIKSLIAPTTQMTKEFTQLGITSDEVQQHLSDQGLAGTLEWLRQTAEKGAAAIGQTVPEAMKKLIGTSPGLQAALETTSDGSNTLAESIKAVGAATADANGDVKGFSEIQGNLSFSFAQFKAQLENTAITIGNIMAPALNNLFKMLDNLLESVSKNTAVGDAFKNIVDVIGDSISALTPVFGPLADAFRDFIKVAGSLLVDALKILAPALGVTLTAFDDLMKALEPLLPQIEKISSMLGDALGKSFQNTLDALLPLLPPLTDLVSSILQGIIDILPELIPSLLDVSKAFAGIWTSLGPLIPVLTQVVKQSMPGLIEAAKITAGFLDALAGSIKDIVKGFSDVVDWVASAISWIGKLPDTIDSAIMSFGKWVIGLGTQANTGAANFGKELQTGAKKAMDDFLKYIEDGGSRVVTYFKHMPTVIGEQIGYLAGTMVKGGYDIMDKLDKGILQGVESVYNFFRTLPTKIQGILTDIGNWLLGDGNSLIKGLNDGINQQDQNVINWFKSLYGRIQGILSDIGKWLVNNGADLIRGIQDGIKQSEQGLWDWFIQLPGRIGLFFVKAQDWLVNAGYSLVTGLAKGIWNGWTWLMNQINSFADSVIAGFKAAFEHGSPSRRMAREVGVHLTTGIAMGMINGMPAIHDAIAHIGGALTNSDAYRGVNVSGLPAGIGGASGLSAGGGILVINNNVAGSVVSERQLQGLNQTQTLRYNFRNPTDGLSLFGRGSV